MPRYPIGLVPLSGPIGGSTPVVSIRRPLESVAASREAARHVAARVFPSQVVPPEGKIAFRDLLVSRVNNLHFCLFTYIVGEPSRFAEDLTFNSAAALIIRQLVVPRDAWALSGRFQRSE